MKLRFLLIASLLVLAKAGYAQPEITFWPDRGNSTQLQEEVENQMRMVKIATRLNLSLVLVAKVNVSQRR